MKKTLLVTALLLAAVSPAMAARKQAPAQMPLTLKPLTTQKVITVSGEYIMFENNTDDESGYGIALRYDKAFAPLMENHYWSWNVGGFSHTWYAQRQAGREDGVGSRESNTFYGGMSFSF